MLKTSRRNAILSVALCLLVFGSTNASGAVLYGSTVNNDLVSFDSADPCTIMSSVRITGLETGEDILGIDFRPFNGMLYALGSTSRIYTIDTSTGVATAVGPQLSVLLDGDAFGFDFNPRANANIGAIRIVSDSGQDLRIHPDTLVVAVDGTLAFGMGDVNEGAEPFIVGAAYTNSRLGFMGTTLYNIDAGFDILTRQDPPNNGTQVSLGSLGLNTNDLAGFDILTTGTPEAPINTAFAAVKESGRTRAKGGCGNSSLVSINVSTGAATWLGSIGTMQPIRGLAARID
ncbi:MAG TPA: DUF4394 domain-containing protein [Pyrinomonadaceae bacterium]